MNGLRRLRTGLGGLLVMLGFALACPGVSWAAEAIPPAPRDHFNDYAGVVPAGFARQLDAELTNFERDTSTQIVVAVYPHLQSNSSLDDYAVRVYQAWGIGLKKTNNGILLLVFTQDHTIRIQTGYGTEGPVPDVLAKRIIENEIAPNFRAGNYSAGLTSGVHALMAAVRGEYRGTGQTVNDQRGHRDGGIPFIFVIIVILFSLIARRFRGPTIYNRGGYTTWINPGGGWGGGGSSGGGGGSFSGGGGSTGGGGASGSW